MPIYLYQCERCREEMEVLQSFAREAPVCCGVSMIRLPTSPAKIQMKEKGVKIHSKGYKEGYAKDYRRRLAESMS